MALASIPCIFCETFQSQRKKMSHLKREIPQREYTFSLKRYCRIDIEAMDHIGLTYREWIICENVEFWASKRKDGYTNITRLEFGSLIGLSEDRMKRILRDLVDRGFLITNKRSHLKPSKKWVKAINLNGVAVPKNNDQSEEPKEKPAGHFEDEFGADELSRYEDKPSLNQIKKKASNIAKKKKIDDDYVAEIAESFWLKHEGLAWDKVGDFFPLLRRYVMAWISNDKKFDRPIKVKKIIKPTNKNEMRLFLKQMSDKARRNLQKFNKKDENGEIEVIVVNHIGMPVREIDGSYLDDKYTDHFFEFFLENFGELVK